MKLDNFKYRMRKGIVLLVCVCVAAMVAACAGGSKADIEDARVITVSILPQKYFLEKIVGDRFDVKCMLDKGGNPETYEPSMSYMMNLEKSDAYFLMGNIGFELSIRSKIKEYNPDIKVYDVSEGIELISGSHHFDADDKEGIDPHTWTSVANARVIIKNMLDDVVELDPEHKAEYESNYRDFDRELSEFQDSIALRLQPVKGEAFVVWHPSLSYFARDYGLEQISLEYDGKEVPVKYLEKKVAYAVSRKPSVFFFQKGMDTNQAQTVNAQIGTRLVEINPLGYDWKYEIRKIADALSR